MKENIGKLMSMLLLLSQRTKPNGARPPFLKIIILQLGKIFFAHFFPFGKYWKLYASKFDSWQYFFSSELHICMLDPYFRVRNRTLFFISDLMVQLQEYSSEFLQLSPFLLLLWSFVSKLLTKDVVECPRAQLLHLSGQQTLLFSPRRL